MQQSVTEQIKQFLADSIRVSKDELNESMEVFASGTFTSLTVIDLLAFLEKSFKIEISPTDLNPENFKDIKSVADLVVQRLAFQKAAA